jgi:hypothetical protein
VKRFFSLIVISMLAAACASAAGGPGPGVSSGTGSGPTTGVRGRTVAGPTCPVERSDSPCPDRPVTGTIVVKREDGTVVKRVTSSADGRFFVALAPGTYVLVGERAAGLHHLTKPFRVTLRSGQVVSLTIVFDTGIR